MKVNRLEAHDRLEHLIADQSQAITQGIEECIKRNPDALSLQEKSPYIYVFAHPRTADDGVNKRMLWQPRLSKPEAQENSYLFRVKSKSDTVEICWMIPPKEMWAAYKKGNVTESDVVRWSITQFTTNKQDLEMPAPDDLTQEQAADILRQFIREKRQNAMTKKILNRASSEVFQTFS